MSYNKNSRKFRFKSDWKSILITVLVVVLSLGAVGGVATLLSGDTKTIHPMFTVGGINADDGTYLETSESIYTKDMFECEGLEIIPDFEANVTYQVFFYDENGDYTESTEMLTVTDKLVVPEDAHYARIVITPDWETINADVEDPVSEVKWYQVLKYANQLTITVARETTEEQ